MQAIWNYLEMRAHDPSDNVHLARPLPEGVEDELGAAKGILAHAADLVMDGQAQALLEPGPCVGDVPPNEALHLQQPLHSGTCLFPQHSICMQAVVPQQQKGLGSRQSVLGPKQHACQHWWVSITLGTGMYKLHLEAHGQVKVLRHVRLRPILHPSVGWVSKRTLLDGAPAQEGIVAHQWGDVAPGDGTCMHSRALSSGNPECVATLTLAGIFGLPFTRAAGLDAVNMRKGRG